MLFLKVLTDIHDCSVSAKQIFWQMTTIREIIHVS